MIELVELIRHTQFVLYCDIADGSLCQNFKAAIPATASLSMIERALCGQTPVMISLILTKQLLLLVINRHNVLANSFNSQALTGLYLHVELKKNNNPEHVYYVD